jgi:hypothetical protein
LYSALHPPVQSLGSLAKLAIANIPDTSEGFKVARNWVKRVCYEFNSTSLGKVDQSGQLFVVLAFDLGREDAQKFIPRTSMYKSKLWPRSPFRGVGNFIVQDFVAFLAADKFGSLTLGTSYLQYVLRDVWLHVDPF